MSSRGGGRGRGGYRRSRNRNSDRNGGGEESKTLTAAPIPDQNYQKRPHIRKNSRWAPRHVNKEEKEKEKEKEKEEEENPNSILKTDSDRGDITIGVKEEPDSDFVVGSSSKLDLGESETGPEIIEELNSDETLKRLNELRLCSVVDELPPEGDDNEALATNHQMQEDELLVMESIYGDNIIVLDSQSGLKCFQVNINVEVPKGICISTKLNASNDVSDFSYSFNVEYLPPIVLTCLLPKSYPSKCPPLFTISAKWLGSSKISDLCRKLDLIWLEQAGHEVMYEWVEWLQGCTLSYLGFDREILLGPYGRVIRNDDEDRRAISGSVSPDIDIPYMKSYDDEKRYDSFCQNIQECTICLSEFAGSEFTRLPCQHFFCEKCMKMFVGIHVTDGTVSKLKCPEAKCEGMIPPGLLKRFLGKEEFDRWESLVLTKTLESMSDVVYCPRCETACLQDKEEEFAQCSKCFYSFCTLCSEKRHVGVECMTPELKLMLLQERQKSTSLKLDQRRREQEMINEIISVSEIQRFAKQCPVCKMAIVRSEGCNKMVCGNCGGYFCYRCNQTISGYDHFRDGGCELFPQDEIQRWEERMNDRQIGRQIAARMGELAPGQVHPCPGCGQPNAKAGNNNHMLCWACQNHYCYLCRKMVRRSAEHYVPKGCKQHSAG